MPITNLDIEERVIEACEWLTTQKKPYYSKAARKYGVHKDRIRRRFLGKALDSSNIGGHNRRLNDDEDRALCAYIDLADEIGLPIREKTLVVAANSILRSHYSDSAPVSACWASRWLSRHPEYQKKIRKPLSAVRKNTHDIEGLERWFRKLKAVRDEYGILDQDIHNMDETGFRIGVRRKHKVITRIATKRQYQSDPDNRDYITSIESISAAGEVHAPLLILKASSLLERWIVDELDDNTALQYSETGYSNDEINLVWLRHFEQATRARTHGRFRLLVLDGFESHIEYDFVQFAQDHSIILFTFPPHATHLLQPLDVVCFQPLKHYHSEAVDNAVRMGDTDFSKIEFLAVFQSFHQEAFKQSTILSAFRKTGIVPYNPRQVVSRLQERAEHARRQEEAMRIEEEEEEEEDLERPKTPTTVSELWVASEGLFRDLSRADDEELISPRLCHRIEKYLHGSIIRLDFGAQVEKDLRAITKAQAARKARNSLPQRKILGGGILTVGDARRRIQQRQLGDQKAEAARFQKLLKRDRKALFVQFKRAAAIARERIRRMGLLEAYGQDV